MDIKKLKVNLQSYGIALDDGISVGRASGAGPAGSVTFLINDTQINAPYSENTGKESPYKIIKQNGKFSLMQDGRAICEIKFPPVPKFYKEKTGDDISYKKIALLHGKDCLATTIVQRCELWRKGNKCKFCAIELSLKNGATIAEKKPEDLAEVVRKAEKEDGIEHLTLTSGTSQNFSHLTTFLARCVEKIREKSSIPIHLQVYPFGEYKKPFEILKDAGVDTLGIHIESFDEEIRNRYIPGKSCHSLKEIGEMLKCAVAIFGKNQVTSFIIIGLGETAESVIEGSRWLAQMGVYPFIVPHHPIRGTETYHLGTPTPQYQEKIYVEVSKILDEYGLSSTEVKAGCVKCAACSAIKEFEIKK
ncbi:MAG: MSMEG_0568 family radical SAM protein [Candidatus Schekmanbacteria bacterium]|nr:MAG: MSMEG_0568 family radical SAM protein [Candidatus Schekmanbacteria bacterium]